MLTEAGCADRHGTFGGANSICSPTSCPRACVCDWNHSGTITSADLHDFLTAFLAGSADVNGDGHTDLADINAFLECFNHPPASCTTNPGPILNPATVPEVLGTAPTGTKVPNAPINDEQP